MKTCFRLRIVSRVSIAILAFGCLLPLNRADAAASSLHVSAADCVVYVNINAPAGGNGASWASAYTDLQTGINAAAPPCQVWVAKGTYKPVGYRLASFYLLSGVSVYGGFLGNEQSLTARDWEHNITTLSGNIGNPDTSSDNAYNVVFFAYGQDATAVLDGFTIESGFANGTASGYTAGGGIDITNGSPTLSNLSLSSNSATDYGGGIYIGGPSHPVLTNLTVTNNTANYGGGIYISNQSYATLDRIKFYNNVAIKNGSVGGDGGGLYNLSASPGLAITNSIFQGNTAQHGGGGLYNYHSHISLGSVSFLYNHADFGGGMLLDWELSSTLANSYFTGNEATSKGGGLYLYDSAPALTQVIFASNKANANSYSTGGAIGNYNSSPTLTNVTFYGNLSTNAGGLYNSEHSNPIIRNSILWGDGGFEIYSDPAFAASTPAITYSLVEGCNPGGTWNSAACGPSNVHNLVDADPQFAAPGSSNFRLRRTSPATNQGNNAFVSGMLKDLAGGPRIYCGVVDLGPYEFDTCPVFLPAVLR